MCGQVCSVSWLFYLNTIICIRAERGVSSLSFSSWLYLPGASKACHVNYKVKAKKWWYGSMFLLFGLSTLIIQWKKIDYHQGNLHDTDLVSSRKYCHTFPSLVPLLTRAAWLRGCSNLLTWTQKGSVMHTCCLCWEYVAALRMSQNLHSDRIQILFCQ